MKCLQPGEEVQLERPDSGVHDGPRHFPRVYGRPRPGIHKQGVARFRKTYLRFIKVDKSQGN